MATCWLLILHSQLAAAVQRQQCVLVLAGYLHMRSAPASQPASDAIAHMKKLRARRFSNSPIKGERSASMSVAGTLYALPLFST